MILVLWLRRFKLSVIFPHQSLNKNLRVFRPHQFLPLLHFNNLLDLLEIEEDMKSFHIIFKSDDITFIQEKTRLKYSLRIMGWNFQLKKF